MYSIRGFNIQMLLDMLTKLYGWLNYTLAGLFRHGPVRLAIVRRYADANGSYVGELYLEGTLAGVSAYRLVGASLDTLPLILDGIQTDVFALDTHNDFLAVMPPMTVRVGANEPKDNETVKKMIRRLPRHSMTLIVQNRFIEHVMEKQV